MITKRVHQYAAFARTLYVTPVATVGINLTNNLFARVFPLKNYPAGNPPYLPRWVVEAVQCWCLATVATATVFIRNTSGTDVVTGMTPVAGTVVQATGLPANVANRQKMVGGFDQMRVEITTNGTGTITNLMVTITVRPYPLDGESTA